MHAVVHLTHPISDRDLERFSQENPGWQVERDGTGSLVMSPTFAAGGAKNAQLTWQFVSFARRHGGTPFDSNAGFTLPDGSVLSPDGAWIRDDAWSRLSAAQRESYAPIVPNVWVELRSATEHVLRLQTKLKIVRGFGAEYVLLIDPYERTTWSEGVAPEGFSLDLDAIFDA